MSKTAQQWITESTLPAEVKEAALAECENRDTFPPSLHEAIFYHVGNKLTQNNFQYWKDIYHYLRRGNDPATAPLPPLRLPVIPWEFVPDEFNFHIFGADGYGWFYESTPFLENGDQPFFTTHPVQESGLFFQTPRWRETLQQRPTKTQ